MKYTMDKGQAGWYWHGVVSAIKREVKNRRTQKDQWKNNLIEHKGMNREVQWGDHTLLFVQMYYNTSNAGMLVSEILAATRTIKSFFFYVSTKRINRHVTINYIHTVCWYLMKSFHGCTNAHNHLQFICSFFVPLTWHRDVLFDTEYMRIWSKMAIV